MIYKISWYNEDSYGWTDHISIVMQGEKETITPKAKDVIKETYPNINFEDYAKTEVKDITDHEVLSFSMGNFV